MNDAPSAGLDPAQASRMVEAAFAAAGISADERQRLACAKTLIRLEPPPGTPAPPGNFAATLLDLVRDSGRD